MKIVSWRRKGLDRVVASGSHLCDDGAGKAFCGAPVPDGASHVDYTRSGYVSCARCRAALVRRQQKERRASR
jgi:hypothetical protein